MEELQQKFENELRTQIDNQLSAKNGEDLRCSCEDWERLLNTNFVIKAALAAIKNMYELGKEVTEELSAENQQLKIQQQVLVAELNTLNEKYITK